MKTVKKKSTENCHFYSRKKSLYIAWACSRNAVVDCRTPIPLDSMVPNTTIAEFAKTSDLDETAHFNMIYFL